MDVPVVGTNHYMHLIRRAGALLSSDVKRYTERHKHLRI